jgi:ATP-dependent exoDNAse (exonuclease V) beta subunit
VLAKARESFTAETEYGKLCSAYVAMTRPRFGLYVVTNALGAKSTAKNFARLLELTLPSNPFESGSANWFERWPVLRSERDAKQAMTLPLPPPIRGTPQPTSPSALKSLTIAHPSDAPRSQDPVGLGTEVHAQLARIEWLPAPKFPDVSAEARSLIEHFLASAAAKSIFSKPETPTLLWREKAFDVMVADQWTSGIFDRVHIHTDPLGLPVSATVFDFKTDFGTAENLAARYEGQMEAYRRAAAALLGLPEKAVEARVVPVRG